MHVILSPARKEIEVFWLYDVVKHLLAILVLWFYLAFGFYEK
jgi:hypothetical protein